MKCKFLKTVGKPFTTRAVPAEKNLNDRLKNIFDHQFRCAGKVVEAVWPGYGRVALFLCLSVKASFRQIWIVEGDVVWQQVEEYEEELADPTPMRCVVAYPWTRHYGNPVNLAELGNVGLKVTGRTTIELIKIHDDGQCIEHTLTVPLR